MTFKVVQGDWKSHATKTTLTLNYVDHHMLTSFWTGSYVYRFWVIANYPYSNHSTL